jgi:hypothetical protein
LRWNPQLPVSMTAARAAIPILLVLKFIAVFLATYSSRL